MRGVFNFLEKVGLVEATAVPPSTPESLVTEQGSMPPSPEILVVPEDTVGEAMAEADIFALAQVPSSVYPAERLLRLMDGLGAMDEKTRKMAISAMDAADDSWSIDDPVADARHKVSALESYRATIDQNLVTQRKGIELEKQASQQHEADAVELIRGQIKELEQLLQQTLTEGAQARVQLNAKLQHMEEAHAQDVARIEARRSQFFAILAQFTEGAEPSAAVPAA